MIPNATLVIQRREWEAGMAVTHDAETFHERKDYDLGHTLRLVDGEHDLFGDDAVVCIPTPGHTVGHQSLRLRLSTGQQVVLTADCCYFARTLDGGALPTFGDDLDEQRRSLVRLRKLRADGATIIPGHDINLVSSMPRVLGANRGT
jgi:glyoxylase-like metal-dependent hydrolase (beta-lactamase superfamily II)